MPDNTSRNGPLAVRRRSALLVEPRRLRSIRERPGAHWFAVAAVCIGAFMGQLDSSIVTIAFPSFERGFHTGIGPVTWVGMSYLISVVAFVTIVGRFADMVGRKLIYVYGFAVFAAASAACALAPNLPTLVGLRVLQGLGAAMLQANSLAIIKIAAPKGGLGRALGIQGAAQALGLALGPSVGGSLIAAGSWRLIFYVNVPIGVVGIVCGLAFIPRSRDLRQRVPLDWAGLSLFVPAVATLLVAVSYGDRWGWGSDGVIALFAVGAAFSASFLGRERRARHPMIDPALFAQRAFTSGIGSGLLAYLVTFGTLLVVPYLFERALGLGPSRAGLYLMVMPLALGVVAPVAGRLGDRIGARTLTVAGMTLVAATLAVLAATGPSTGEVVAGLVLVGLGFGCFTPANNAAVLSTVPADRSGEASGVVNVTRATGTSLGLALTGLVFALGGGDHQTAVRVIAGYHDALWFLSAAALVAGGIAALRPARQPAGSAATPIGPPS